MRTRTGLLNCSLLGEALPGAQFTSRHAAVVPAPPEQVWAILHELTAGDLRVSRPLAQLRAGGRRIETRRPLLDTPGPWAPLTETRPRGLAGGMIGKPWRPRPERGPSVRNLAELRAFHDPGWLKFGIEWLLSPLSGDRTYLETITLCEATDAHARCRFRLYWALIRPFSGLIRRDVLAAVVRRARAQR